MDNTTQQSTIQQADELLLTAQNEMCKPAEDVVDYMVCNNAYKAVKSYLAGFLLQQGVDGINTEMHTKDLLEQCQAIDPKFKALDLTLLYNKAEGADVFMDYATAKEFMELARQTQELAK